MYDLNEVFIRLIYTSLNIFFKSDILGNNNNSLHWVLASSILNRSAMRGSVKPELSQLAISGLGNSFLLFGPSEVDQGPYAGTYSPFENVPDASLKEIENIVSIFPTRNALSISQDRIKEKQFFNNLNLKTVQYAPVDTFEDFSASIAQIKIPSILKTCRQGYDGKGQLLITKNTTKREIEKHLLLGPCILESFIDFNKEVSVVLARNQSGQVVSFDPGENIHRAGILQSTIIPARIPKMVQIDVVIIAGKIINALEYVGVLGVETFLSHQNEIIINEIAPRVHNSGHLTINAYNVSQFENHVRAVCSLKQISLEKKSNAEMINLIGDQIVPFRENLKINDNQFFFDYLKKDIKEKRKMGHLTILK